MLLQDTEVGLRGQLERLTDRLGVTHETLAAARRHNRDLEADNAELHDQLSRAQRLISHQSGTAQEQHAWEVKDLASSHAEQMEVLVGDLQGQFAAQRRALLEALEDAGAGAPNGGDDLNSLLMQVSEAGIGWALVGPGSAGATAR